MLYAYILILALFFISPSMQGKTTKRSKLLDIITETMHDPDKVTDTSGNITAHEITANLNDNVTSNASNNILKPSDTKTDTLKAPSETVTRVPFTASINTGDASATPNTLSFETNGVESMYIDGSSNVTITGLANFGVIHTDVTGLLSTSSVVDADIADATISNAKLAAIASANTADAIVVRDASGDFSAGVITADLSGNATSATTATNVSGALVGDVTGTQGATVVSLVGGQTAANVAAATVLANAATNLNTASTIVKRDASGNFSATTITANLTGSASNNVLKAGDTMTGTLQLPAGSTAAPSLVFTGSTTTGLSASSDNLSFSNNGSESMNIASDGVVSINEFTVDGVIHNDSFGNLSSSLIVNTDVSPTANIADTKLDTISTAGKVANSATTATSANTANTIVLRDASGDFAAGIITANLVGNVTGSASNNVLKAGDTMTGTLILPAGSAASPSLKFSGSTNTGISAATANVLSFDTNGTERMNINATGGVTVSGLNSVGVVHTDATGLLSTSLIVNADITNATISNAKLATISSSNTSGAIVVRDGSGNFSTNQISIAGAVSNPSDVATKQYVDDAISTGIVAKAPAVVVSITNVTINGTQTIDGVALIANDRVLLVGQTDPIENGLWEVQVGAWTRPADFASGTAAGQAYVLILSGDVYAGSAWLCNTPAAIIDTDPITFALFSLPDQTTAANVGAGVGQVFRNKTGATLNFRTLAEGQHIDITNNADDITFATDATDANTASTIVARDASGNFSATTITANLTGSASNNVLKAGDSMTGALNMLTQNEVRYQDAAGGQYVGINAPTTVPTSYTLSLPSAAPTTNQTLRAGSGTATQLQWVSESGTVPPATSRTIYVTQYGNDSTGDGSFDFPYASLAKAIDIANPLASASDPISILISAGTYIENNSSGALSITSEGISIIGDSPLAVILMPNTPANDFLLINETAYIGNATFASSSPNATGISLTAGNLSILNNLIITNFATGIECGGTTSSYLCELCTFINNNTGLVIDDTIVEVNSCTVVGGNSFHGTPANTGISIFGSVSVCAMSGGSVTLCSTGLDVGNNSLLTASAVVFKLNGFDVIQTAASHMTLSACTFAITTTATEIDIQISGSGTYAEIIGCQFNGKDMTSIPQATALHISNGAVLDLNGGGMKNYTTALHVGTPTDTSTTQLNVSGFTIQNCTTDILQEGTSYLNFNASTASSSKISIDDPTNVTLAFFDLDNNNALEIGSITDADITLLQAAISTTNNPGIDYLSSLYSTQAIGYNNPTANPSTLFALSNDNTNVTTITTNRTKATNVRLISDEGSPVGGTTALRGWNVQKNATTAELAFNYQNSDTVGQGAIAEYTVMQLDGVNNQVQLPTAATQIVFASDTNLYRSAANVLKTDDNFIVGTLTPNRAVITNTSNQLASSVTTDTEISYLSGTTSAVQTQLNGKVAKAGDTMTGTLQLPAGSTAAPSLTFTGSTTTGLSANSDNLSFSNNGVESMKISSGGIVSIDGFTVAGVVHNDASGNLTSSLIVNADITNTTITDAKLATISTAGKVANSATTATSANTANAIVARDASGNFSAGTITANLSGNATTATTATSFSGSLVGDVTGTQGATVVSLVGGQTAANVADATTLVSTATSNNVINTLVKRDASGNFSAGTITANLSGNATTATTATTATNFSGSLVGDVTGTQGATVVSLVGGQTAANVADATTLVSTATSNNVVNTLVKRDASGNFSAGIITANLSGNATTATTAITATNFSGSLVGDVTGTQGATVVSLVGGQTAASVADATSLVSTATSNNVVNTLVKRDASGNFSAGIITANLSGNATTATTAITATNFSGSLVGDVTGTQGATVVSLVGGQTAASVAAATSLVSTATSNNVINTLVQRDASGNFSAGTITAALNGNATTATTATSFSGPLVGDVTGTQGATVVSLVGGQTAANVAAATVLANAATNLNTASTIVKRDASGNFSAGTITAALSGNATTATTATNFSGSLVGDVTGTQGATVVSLVGGQTAANVAAATVLANAATNLNTASTIVKRDASGNFSAGAITLAGNLILSTEPSTSTAGNIIKGSSRFIHDFGTNNTFTGINSGNFTMTGSANSGFGVETLQANTTGSNNTAIGYQAMDLNTTGTNNTAIGFRSLLNNTTGIQNTASGVNTLQANTTGTDNTAIGYNALAANAAGTNGNTAVGSNAMAANTTGTLNAACGYNAMAANTTGTGNTAFGHTTLTTNTTGGFNTAIGWMSLAANTTGGFNTAVGVGSLQSNTTGANNAACGNSALGGNTTGSQNNAFGDAALLVNTTGNDNIAMGYFALQANTTGSSNVAIGRNSMYTNTTGFNNTAVGWSALDLNTTGTSNTAIGFQTLFSNTSGQDNVAVGFNALIANTTVSQLTAVGSGALASNTSGTLSTAVGYNALTAQTTATQNTAVGHSALASATTGATCTAVGYNALNAFNSAGNGDNSALGSRAAQAITTGTGNTCIGRLSGSGITTGSNNITLGFSAGNQLTTGSNNIDIGNAGVAAEATTIRIGTIGTQTACFIAGINGATSTSGSAVFVNSSGQLGTTTSSARFKHDINNMTTESEAIYQLNPVTFIYNEDTTEKKQYGLIAEEVDQVMPDIVVRDEDGKPYTVEYHVLPALLLNELQKQHIILKQLEKQSTTIDSLTETINDLKKIIEEARLRIKQLEVNAHVA